MNRTHRFLLGAGAVLLLVALLASGSVVAKYVREAKAEKNATAAKFYFESNYLTENGHEYYLNAGTQSVTLELYNFENALRISEVDTTYTITVETADQSFQLTSDSYVAHKDSKTTTQVPLNFRDGYFYKVTVVADGGFQKTMSATFIVAEAPDGVYMNVTQTEQYVLLTVWTENNITGTATIYVPKGLIPDASDPLLSKVENYKDGKYGDFTITDSTSFSQGAYVSRSYRFFKTGDYSGSQNFTVKVGEKDAVESEIP